MTEEKTSEQQQAEADAIAQGWNPDYAGDNAKTAEEYLEFGKKIPAVQSANNKKLLDKVSGLEVLLQTQAEEFKGFRDQQFKTIAEAQKKGYDKAVKEIEAKQLKAVEDGDTDEYKALDAEKKNLEKPKPAEKVVDAPKVSPELMKWHKENDWFKLDEKGQPLDPISAAAINYDLFLTNTRKDLTGVEALKEVEKHIKTVFPDQFKPVENKLETGHSSTPKPGGKSYADLPSEAKKACDMQVKKYGITKEEYSKQYFAEV